MTDERLEEIRTSTRDDEVLQQLKEVIQTGLPEKKQELPAVLAPYFSFRDELSVYDGLVFKGEQLLIHKQMRPKTKERTATQLTHRCEWLFEKSQRVYVLARYDCGTEGVHLSM